jgi:hypothetical protein
MQLEKHMTKYVEKKSSPSLFVRESLVGEKGSHNDLQKSL